MRFFSILLILFLTACSTANKTASESQTVQNSNNQTKQEYAVHSQPSKPLYLSDNSYDVFKKAIKPVPTMDSETQKKDIAILLDWQKKRTSADCERAESEVKINLNTFFGKPYGPLEENEIKHLNTFFEQVRNDSAYYILQLKIDFPRQRPFVYNSEIQPCIKKEATQSYPSGHSTLAHLYSLILSDIYPQKRKALIARANQLAEDRVLGGVHHTSDIEAGKQLAKTFFKQFKKSKDFNAELKKFKTIK